MTDMERHSLEQLLVSMRSEIREGGVSMVLVERWAQLLEILTAGGTAAIESGEAQMCINGFYR